MNDIIINMDGQANSGVNFASHFGVKADGVTDDTEALQEALIHGDVILPMGRVCLIRSIEVINKIYIGTLKLIDGNTADEAIVMKDNSALIGVRIEGNRNNCTVDKTVSVKGKKVKIKDCIFTSGYKHGIFTSVGTSKSLKIDSCDFDDWGSSGFNSYPIILRSSKARVTDCTFENTHDGHCIRTGLYDSDDSSNPVVGTIIDGCHFEDSEQVGIVLELHTKDTIISNNYFKNLEQAIKMEKEGNTVEDVKITNNIFDGIRITTAFYWRGLNVTATNNTFRNSAGGVILHKGAIFANNHLYGIGDENHPSIEGYSTETDITIHNNHIYDAPRDAISACGDVTVSENRIYNSTRRGINIYGSNDVASRNIALLSGNRLYIDTGYGIVVSSSVDEATLSANIVKGNCIPYHLSGDTNLIEMGNNPQVVGI